MWNVLYININQKACTNTIIIYRTIEERERKKRRQKRKYSRIIFISIFNL